MIEFSRLPAPLPSMQLWGGTDTERSYCITFDRQHPDEGFSASWQKEGQATVYLPDSFASFDEAKDALEAVQRKHAQ